MSSLSTARLYAIVDLGYVDAASAPSATLALCQGGAGIVQLRAKGHQPSQLGALGKEMAHICRGEGVPFIINDFPELAAEVGADGVHVGQDDGALTHARSIVGSGKIIGRSTHSLTQAKAAAAEGADYIGFGPLFPTPTKAGRPAIGLADVATVHQDVRCPIFCIGGINETTLPEVLSAGAKRVVIVSALLKAPDIRAATAQVVRRLEQTPLSAPQ